MINYGIKQEAFIEKYFRMGATSSKGWKQNLGGCPYCHDGRSKNPRSHFLFMSDEIGFQCFNCGGKHRFSGNNINTLAGFIAKSAWKKIGAVLLELKKDKIFPDSDLKHQEEITSVVEDKFIGLIDYKEVELPDVAIEFNQKAKDIAPVYRKRFIANKQKAKLYLEDHGLLETAKTKKLFICMDGEYSNRLIIPIYFDDKLVSWTARALFPTKTKFLYPPSTDDFNDRGKIIYGLDKIFQSKEVKQIFVTESILDAWHLSGMAVLSKNITQDQLDILKHFNFQKKKLVFVLDNDKVTKWDSDLKGAEMGKIVFAAQQPNWEVSKPDFGEKSKDVSDSIVNEGWLSTYDEIMSGVITSKQGLSNGVSSQMKTTSLVLKTKFKSKLSGFKSITSKVRN